VKTIPQLRETAIIYVPRTRQRDQWIAICLAYCRENGYSVEGVVDSWRDARAALYADQADVAVVASRRHLPNHRTPRLEVVPPRFVRKVAPPAR